MNMYFGFDKYLFYIIYLIEGVSNWLKYFILFREWKEIEYKNNCF